jgi:hypothetical protein
MAREDEVTLGGERLKRVAANSKPAQQDETATPIP